MFSILTSFRFVAPSCLVPLLRFKDCAFVLIMAHLDFELEESKHLLRECAWARVRGDRDLSLLRPACWSFEDWAG